MDDAATRRQHAMLDTRRAFGEEEGNLEEIARAITGRHRERAVPSYTGDMSEIPQRLLMPSVHDANLWQVRVKVRIFLRFLFPL